MSCSTPKPSNQQILDALFCLAPSFKTTDPDTLACYNMIIDMLWCQINWEAVSCCGIMIFVYLLAHTLTLRLNPLTGVATNLSEGDLSIGLAVSATSGILESTSYGKAYQDLLKRKIAPFTISNLPPGFNVWSGGCGWGC